ncbi:MAG TPA: disulfide bond formation protein B [Acidimicrobiia bacterium]
MTTAVSDVDVANKFFLVLTLAANAAVLGFVVVALTSRPLRLRVVSMIGPDALRLAWLVAAVATAGSLYYSEAADFAPCLLCWYQRICMYPLVAVLGVGAVRRDPGTRWFAAPLVAVGAPLALYHWLVERVPSLSDSVSCSAAAPCAIPWFEELGFVTLAYMDLSAFLLIGALLIVDWLADRAGEEVAP